MLSSLLPAPVKHPRTPLVWLPGGGETPVLPAKAYDQLLLPRLPVTSEALVCGDSCWHCHGQPSF